ncbi:hypothetical protein A9K55_003944 [Cordyceps militaris]|uniref:Uncharacterized protein n=1 Tax=Cordyceps militaris TaxID=73501 RepID=A0A2H4SL60_CORMI|nr:hypothetical protein A9K55_003944 [Cordyceps militaris]
MPSRTGIHIFEPTGSVHPHAARSRPALPGRLRDPSNPSRVRSLTSPTKVSNNGPPVDVEEAFCILSRVSLSHLSHPARDAGFATAFIPV